MTEKNTGSENSSLFILIIPLALIAVVAIKTWKLVLSVVFLGVSWRLWQQYTWQQTKQQIDPYFKTLLQDKRGNVTVLDLAQTAEISSAIASRYLLNKAQYYGAELLSYGDDRDTYYFLTAGVIQDILADSEPDSSDFVLATLPPNTSFPPSQSVDPMADPLPDHSLTTILPEVSPTPDSEAVPQTSQQVVTTLEEATIERRSIDYFPDINT